MREVDRRSKYEPPRLHAGRGYRGPGGSRRNERRHGSPMRGRTTPRRSSPATHEDTGEGRARHLSARHAGRQLLHHRGQAVGRQGGEGPRRQGDDRRRRRPARSGRARRSTRCPTPKSAGKADRVELLQGIEQSEFFQKIRGDLIVSLYNQKELWPKFGYEGSSAEHGGYIKRGFADIDWLPKV